MLAAGVNQILTELVEVRLHAICPWNRADEPSLQEGAPLVHQTAVSSIVILYERAHEKYFHLHLQQTRWYLPHTNI